MSAEHAGDPHQPRSHRRRPGPAGPAGRQGRRGRLRPAGLQQGAVRHRHRAVLLLNRTGSAASITARWSDLGLTGAAAGTRPLGARPTWAASPPATPPPCRPARRSCSPSPGTDGGGQQGKRIVGAQSGRCLDVPNAATTNGTQSQLWDCNGPADQSWTATGKQRRCTATSVWTPTTGAPPTAPGCHLGLQRPGQPAVEHQRDGTITGVQSGLCLDANGAAPPTARSSSCGRATATQPAVDPVVARTTVRGSVRRSV